MYSCSHEEAVIYVLPMVLCKTHNDTEEDKRDPQIRGSQVCIRQAITVEKK